MQVFPAIDLLDGKAVRLEQGRPESAKIYSHAPWELARRFAAAGAPRLHVVDLDAALSGGAKHNHDTIEKILGAAGAMEVEVGGGIRTLEACARIFSAGRQVRGHGNRGHQDARGGQGGVQTLPQAHRGRGGRARGQGRGGGLEGRHRPRTPWTIGQQVADAGAAAVLYTDIGRDGMRTGPNLEATARLARTIEPCAVIASGGVAKLEDIHQVRETGATAVVIGKALYEGAFTVEEALARAPRRRQRQE